MASNISYNETGTTKIATEQNGSAEHYQKIKVVDGTAAAYSNFMAVDANGRITVNDVFPSVSSATLSNVASSASTGTIVASNANRKGLIIYNDSTQVLYLKFGATASATSYTVQIASQATWVMPPNVIYTGIIDGIWASANGNARVTEL